MRIDNSKLFGRFPTMILNLASTRRSLLFYLREASMSKNILRNCNFILHLKIPSIIRWHNALYNKCIAAIFNSFFLSRNSLVKISTKF